MTALAPTHRHKKRGSLYELLGIGKMQTDFWFDGLDEDADAGNVDMRPIAIYRAIDDGSLWARPREEFEDGRFEKLPDRNAGEAQVATAALFDIVAERRRQIEVEGWNVSHDDGHGAGELARAGAVYALSSVTSAVPLAPSQSIRGAIAWLWPWAAGWFKPSIDPRRDLVKAGALILAEIDRLDRIEAKKAAAI